MLPLTITVLFLFGVAPPLDYKIMQGIRLSQKHDHEASEKILGQIRSDNPSYLFFRMINAFQLNNKEQVLKWADELIYYFGEEVPERYLTMAHILKAEAETWTKEKDDLFDIARDMRIIQDRLKNNKGGPTTQDKQKEVADRLKKMIDKIEKAEADASKEKSKAEAGADAKAKDVPLPASDTLKGEESGTGKVDPKRVKEITAIWGKLPEKERASVLRELTRNIPTKDRQVVERYFRELQKRK
jgi:hypothetical protein